MEGKNIKVGSVLYGKKRRRQHMQLSYKRYSRRKRDKHVLHRKRYKNTIRKGVCY